MAGERIPLGHPDFHPSRQRPYGWRGDGSGVSPAAKPPLKWSWDKKTHTGEVLWRRRCENDLTDPAVRTRREHITDVRQCRDGDLDQEVKRLRYPLLAHWLTESFGYTTPAPVTDGRLVWAVFGHGVTVCYDLDGNLEWAGRFNGGIMTNDGLSQHPCLIGNALIHTGFDEDASVGWDADSGKRLWTMASKQCLGSAKEILPYQAHYAGAFFGCGGIVKIRLGDKDYALYSTGVLVDPATGELIIGTQGRKRAYE